MCITYDIIRLEHMLIGGWDGHPPIRPKGGQGLSPDKSLKSDFLANQIARIFALSWLVIQLFVGFFSTSD
jgi:hypothetical protein